MELEEIIEIVRKTLSDERFYHSKCVMERCEEVAKMVGFDVDIAKKVGIAHDIAKEMPDEEKIQYCKDNNIEIDNIEEQKTILLHAKIGADIVKKQFGFSESMANAIKSHTTGLPNMDILAKILLVADCTSDERGFPDIEYTNQLLQKDIDEAVLYILDKKIEIQIKRHETMHTNSVITRNWMINNMKK